jgi:hypothetical protein
MSDREAFRANREAGLRARHETREARAVRKAVAEEIALAIEAFQKESAAAPLAVQLAMGSGHNYLMRAIELAREIGSKDPA